MIQSYRLVIGQHIGPDYSKEVDEATGKRPSKVYNAPCKVRSEIDLVAKHGPKFAYIAGKIPTSVKAKPEVAEEEEEAVPEEPAAQESEVEETAAPTAEELSAMSLNELKAYATERGIDISSLGNNKRKIVAAIVR